MGNITRQDLVKRTATMNQMRNIVYHLIKFMRKKGLQWTDIINRLKRMGRNIAKTEEKLFDINETSPSAAISKIYSLLLYSNVNISVKESEDSFFITVEDRKCPLCKYYREDLDVAPCTIITSMVACWLRDLGWEIIDDNVAESRSLGAVSCIHTYEILKEGKH